MISRKSSKVFVELNEIEMQLSGFIGVIRHVMGMNKIGVYGVNNSKNGWQFNCTGTNGEMVVAKYLNFFWLGSIGNFKAKDVGRYQVRTNHLENGDLILHDRDGDADIFILVLANNSPKFCLAGWMYGIDGKKSEWYRNGAVGRPAYFVSQKNLNPMWSLPKL